MQIYKFLAGLNVDFGEVRGRIIGRQTLPPIGEVFSEVRREESRRSDMLGKKALGSTIEGSSLDVGGSYSKNNSYPPKSDEKPRVCCDFLNKHRHTHETCWRIHGKPANWKRKVERSNCTLVPNEAETNSFTKEQLNHLHALLKSNSNSYGIIPSTASIAQSGPEFGEDDWQC
ncbi:uncharacterized protein LOC133829003 [Humulus lupulus]|uniref:uncharacterized protein LOC133829003 n=1 Tax=Humulus lupulus TaxID=3486 RepID=UPI002B413ECF|nr:uncharacterized protein LOC133829003 [Humulus lupulus]